MSTGSSRSFLGQLLTSREFSDATFVCCGEEFRVHKAIVCTQSAPIKAALQDGFKETETNRIEMDKFRPGTVKRMVQFLYTGAYDAPDGEDGNHGNPAADDGDGNGSLPLTSPASGSNPEDVLSKNIRVNTFGDYYQVPESNAATRILLEHIRVNSIGDYYQISGLVSLANSKIKQLHQDHNKDDLSWIESLPTAINEAAESTGDKEVLEILAEAATPNISHLLGMEEFRSLPVMSEFAIDLLQLSIRKNHAFERELEETQHQLRRTKEREERLEDELDRLQECVGILSRTRQCRNSNCSAEFQCLIWPGERVLRCLRCHCKHY